MNINYYQILGVPETATPDEIKHAYRGMAMKFHPDRGGSHEQMLTINEAFEVLYNSKLRSEYDFARTHQNDSNAQSAAERTAQAARTDAANYPREWSAFDKWLNSMAADFQQAEYGREKSGPFSFPTTKNSVSAKLFIYIGAAAGFVFFSIPLLTTHIHPIAIILPIMLWCMAWSYNPRGESSGLLHRPDLHSESSRMFRNPRRSPRPMR